MKSSKVEENLEVVHPQKLRQIKENINFPWSLVSKVGDKLSLLHDLDLPSGSGSRLEMLPDQILTGPDF